MADLNLQLRSEGKFGKQKAGLNWFKDKEGNTKFFHSIFKGRRSRLKVKRIRNEEGIWVEYQAESAKDVVIFYQK